VTEAVRLVIWDLDETFWKGTLTEGGIDEGSHFGDTVKELARRGIVSSICSKNDFEPTKAVLERLNLWEYFIFPSINWNPKGTRIRDIVEQVQLRAATVLFIDDNPMNLEEARHMVEGLQVADESILPSLLESPLLVGRPDPEMKRLADYKILEIKQKAREQSSGDTHGFLRQSRITVELDYDIEGNIDRVIELINRTNQLNYTKHRVSDDPETARQQVLHMIGGYDTHTALVRVRDQFGDYGYVGFFVQKRGAGYDKLEHYCFSCRTLGMFVELWLYRKLGRPDIDVQGNVLSDLFDDSNPADWISYRLESDTDSALEEAGETGILLCGGCDLESVAHYLQPVTKHFRLFANTIHLGGELRRDHSSIVAYSAQAPDEQELACLKSCGYRTEDLNIDFSSGTYGLIVFSFWADLYYSTYRQHSGKTLLTYTPSNLGYNNLTHFFEPDLRNAGVPQEGLDVFRYFKANMMHVGQSSEADFKNNLHKIFSAIPATTHIVVLGSSEGFSHVHGAILDRHLVLNQWQAEVAANFTNVEVVQIDTFIKSDAEQVTDTHFTRVVYQRLALWLKARYAAIDTHSDVNVSCVG